MAAGEGTRLLPLTERWPKPILPIDGRPVIATLLRELAAAGLGRVYVVTGYLAEQVEELVGDGSGFLLEVRFARQPGVLGSAGAGGGGGGGGGGRARGGGGGGGPRRPGGGCGWWGAAWSACSTTIGQPRARPRRSGCSAPTLCRSSTGCRARRSSSRPPCRTQ